LVMRGIFRPERDLATGSWRKLHHEELNNFISHDVDLINKY
jgi:hypothetical protein